MNSAASIPAWIKYDGAEAAFPAAPAWLTDFQHQQWMALLKAGLPVRKDERWKYTDLSFLANKHFVTAKHAAVETVQEAVNQHRLQRGDSTLFVFVNGYFMPELSDIAKLPEQVIACNFSQAFKEHPQLIKTYWLNNIDAQKYPFASLNAAMCRDGLFFYVPDHCEFTQPIHLLFIVTDENEFIAHPYHMIILGKQSKLTLLEEHFSFTEQPYLMNLVTSITAEREAKLEYIKLQHQSSQALHMAHIFIQQMQDSDVACTNFSMGSLFARDEIIVKLQEAGAHCSAFGFYHLQYDHQYIDHHIDIDHAAPRSNSEMLYKGILDKTSRAVFNGRLYVEKDAQKIHAYQANHNLLLSPTAEVYSKPELEIYADDVKCKHGATTGQLDQDALFYLRSRGIEKTDAINILLHGFVEEIIQRISHPGIKMRVQEGMLYL